MTAKELREKRAELAKQVKTMADKANAEGKDFAGEDLANWEKVNADYDALTRRIQVAERVESVEAEQRAPAAADTLPGRDDYDGRERRDEERVSTTEEDRALALQAWFRHQVGAGLRDEHVEACRRLAFRPEAVKLDLRIGSTGTVRAFQRVFQESAPVEERALSAVSLAAGAGVVPETLIRQLEAAMLAFGGVLQVAEILRTASGEKMTWPTADDTGNTGALVGESGAVTTLDPSFGLVTWDAYKYTSREILVPFELLEDSAVDLVGVIGAMLGERLGRIQATHMTTGDGASKPRGLITAATVGKTAASATAIAADEIFDLVHSVDPAYRTGAGFLMHDNVMLHLRKLKDGNGQYLWQSGMAAGAPDRLLGYPVTISQEMASSVATGNKTIAFGQLAKYKVRQVNVVRLYRLVERHRENDQDAFLAFLRADGNLLDAGTRPVKVLQQA